jgi:hypothetical protein
MVLGVLTGCNRGRTADAVRRAHSVESQKSTSEGTAGRVSDQRSIGTATMTENGTIILNLRAEGPDGTRGEARLTYSPTHERYTQILDHLGGLQSGQSKPVPPWPEDPR